MRRTPPRTLLLAALLLTPLVAPAQWQILDSNTTADLRGIDNVGGGVVWASGSDGTVLRSEDAGYVWQHCAVPPNAEHLDFRGIQAFDANTAIVMSSGIGPLSRLYKTTDGCQTWTLLFTNPDKDGFWDALKFVRRLSFAKATRGNIDIAPRGKLYILGDPVRDHFVVWVVPEPLKNGHKPERLPGMPQAGLGEGAFAASNSSLWADEASLSFVTGGKSEARWIPVSATWLGWRELEPVTLLPPNGEASSGMFSVAFTSVPTHGLDALFTSGYRMIGVAVGGDYQKPNDREDTADFTTDGLQWTAAETPPHGYRSAVAYDAKTKTWITVGLNGTDISTDDGRNWHALKPDPKLHDAPDADRNWNALSLPFVAGPHGRIGLLEPSALATASH